MPDDRLNGDDSPTAGGAQSDDGAQSDGGDLSSLFEHAQEMDPGAAYRDDVGALFAQPTTWVASPGSAESPTNLFAAPDSGGQRRRRTQPRSMPIPFRHEPEHAAPTYRMTRPQLFAMGVGLLVTLAGAGWALATPAVSTPTALASPVATVDHERVAKIGGEVDALAAAVQAAQASAASFEAPLAAMAGSSDEAARGAADAARQAYASAIAAVKVPAKPGSVDRSSALDQTEHDIAAAQSSLDAATTAFHAAITSFAQTLPAYAATAVADNADADEAVRTATTQSADAVAGTDPFAPTAFATWDGWRTAHAALLADEARVISEWNSSGSGGSGGTGGDGSGSPPPAPVSPDPAPPAQPPTDPGTAAPAT